MFPKNAWYAACMPDEIDSKPLGRRICGEAMVLYRGPQNQAAALEDFDRILAAEHRLARATMEAP